MRMSEEQYKELRRARETRARRATKALTMLRENLESCERAAVFTLGDLAMLEKALSHAYHGAMTLGVSSDFAARSFESMRIRLSKLAKES